jgi:predicted DNA-binding WGR domain protein
MAIVSTIRAEAITNTHNDGARALRTFLSFAEAQARGDGPHGQAILATLNPEAQRVFSRAPAPDPLRDALAAALRARGHVVQEYVGSASFRCDLAIVAPDGRSHALAILLDGDAGDAIADRYVFQPTILRRFGWRVIDIPSHAWLRQPEAVIAQIEAALRGDENAVDDDPFEPGSALPLPVVPVPSPVPEAPAAETSAEGFTTFEFTQGASDKFWKIAVNGADVTVVYGRRGTKGSSVVKTYETPERAAREANKLTLEKTRKGYVETS